MVLIRPVVAGEIHCPHCRRMVTDRHFYRSGKVRCQTNRRWSREMLWELDELLQRGDSDAAIARRLGVSPASILNARKRYGLQSRTRRLLPARRVAELLGVRCAKTVTRWIRARWIRGRRLQRRGPHRQWGVTWEALCAFLQDPAHWHRWDPARITDGGLREWATGLRCGVRFLSLSTVAELCCVEPGTVGQWIDKGWLPAVRNGNRLVREEDALRFRRPGEERRRFVLDAIATLQRRGLTLAAIGELIGIDRGHVGEYAHGRWEPTRRVADRFGMALRETAHLPAGDDPVCGTRGRPSGFDELVARVRSQ